MKNLG